MLIQRAGSGTRHPYRKRIAIKDGEPHPNDFLEPLRALGNDPSVRNAYERGNEAALSSAARMRC